MRIDTTERWQLFWVFIRERGACAVCGREVSPEHAATDRPLPLPTGNLSELEGLRLVHDRCRQ